MGVAEGMLYEAADLCEKAVEMRYVITIQELRHSLVIKLRRLKLLTCMRSIYSGQEVL